MALTLAQAALLSNDVVRQGVIEAIVKESGLLERLPFIEMVGNSLKYSRERTLAGAEFFAVGSTWTESTPTVEQKSAALKILGGDADVDKFLAQTRGDGEDPGAGGAGGAGEAGLPDDDADAAARHQRLRAVADLAGDLPAERAGAARHVLRRHPDRACC